MKRIEYIDIAKGIGIILMIIGHMPSINDYLNRFIYSFHMPLFFIISGYFFKHKDNKQCIKSILKRLIVPYIITCCAIIGIKMFLTKINNNSDNLLEEIKTWGLASLYGSGGKSEWGIGPIGAIWFLLALGWAMYFMNKIYTKKYQYIWVSIIAYIGYKTTEFIWLPLSIQAGMVGLLFFYIGLLCKENSILDKKISMETYLGIIAIFIFGVKYCGKVYMVSNYYENGLLDIIIALCGVLLCVKVSMLIEKYSKFSKKAFIFIGKNSLQCMCIHLISLNCFDWKNTKRLIENIGIKDELCANIIINIVWAITMTIFIKCISNSVKRIKEKNKRIALS